MLSSAVAEYLKEHRGRSSQVVESEGVAALPAGLLDVDQSGGLEPLQVPCRRRPRMAEPIGQFARGHGTSTSVQCHQNVASVLVSERPEDRFDLVELA